MYKMLHMFPREKCNVVKYYLLNVASTRKPLAREGSRSRRCHKVRDAIGIARVTCDSQFRREGDDSITHPPRFFFSRIACSCLHQPRLSARSRAATFGQPTSLSFSHELNSLILTLFLNIRRKFAQSFTKLLCVSSIRPILIF